MKNIQEVLLIFFEVLVLVAVIIAASFRSSASCDCPGCASEPTTESAEQEAAVPDESAADKVIAEELEAAQASDTGKPCERQYLGEFKLSAYCGCKRCSGSYGTQTSTGATAAEGVTIAVDPNVIPYGTRVYIDGVGERIAQDCGGAIKGNKIDVYVQNHADAYKDEYNKTASVWIANETDNI